MKKILTSGKSLKYNKEKQKSKEKKDEKRKRWNPCNCTHTHTLCLLENKNLKILGLISVAKKLYLKYEEIKVDMQLLHRQTVF